MPYLLLALLGLIPAGWRTFRRRDAAAPAIFFTAASLCDLADWIAYSSLDLYRYSPHLSSLPVLDETLGVILAEFIFVGSFSVLLVERRPHWFWAVLGAVVVTTVQMVFVRRDLLVLNGWTPWLNAAGFLVYFSLMQAYHTAMERHGLGNGWLRLIAQAGVVSTFNSLAILALKVNEAYVIHVNLLPFHAKNQSIDRLILHLAIAVPMGVWVLRSRWLNRPGRILIAALSYVALSYIRVLLRLQSYRPPWGPVTEGLLFGLALTAAVLTDSWLQAWSHSPRTGRPGR